MFYKLYFNIIMNRKRRLEFDKDEEDFTQHNLMNCLTETPESITFDCVSQMKAKKTIQTNNEIKKNQIRTTKTARSQRSIPLPSSPITSSTRAAVSPTLNTPIPVPPAVVVPL